METWVGREEGEGWEGVGGEEVAWDEVGQDESTLGVSICDA